MVLKDLFYCGPFTWILLNTILNKFYKVEVECAVIFKLWRRLVQNLENNFHGIKIRIRSKTLSQFNSGNTY